MKRKSMVIILLSLILLVVFFETQIKVANASFNNVSEQVIPDESIRLRILANSDSQADQELKRSIRDKVNEEITQWVFGIESIDEARTIIKRELPSINKIVQQSLSNKGLNETFSVTFGKVPFPTKLYGDLVYPAGEYEAVLISIGEATGANWWCVLFPPLCFLDFDNGDAVQTDEEAQEAPAPSAATTEKEPEVKFFVFEIVKNLFATVGNLFT
ncbi:stage II sporulation protein R [Pseudalkalibacillus sp. A8]|uniref:stage II sporulation protein R n=1 Tax=Pseudalkalibacillus sp. A8 TaxID=3382641 RepID=UPI0038B5D87D